MAPLVQERITTMGEVPGLVDFLFLEEPEIDEGSWEKAVTRDEAAVPLLEAAVAAYEGCDWTADALRDATVAVGEQAGKKLAKAQAPVRVAVTGRTVGPPLFESLEVLGRVEVGRRLEAALGRAAAPTSAPTSGPTT